MKKNKELTSWADITLEQFCQIQKIISDKDATEDDKLISLVKLLIDKNADDLTPIEFYKLTNHLFFLKEPINKKKIQKQYILNGHAYNCITKLENLTTAQFIDYNNLIKEKLDNDKIVEVIAILLIPDKHKYNTDYDIDEVKGEITKYMKVEEALGVADFFTQSFKKQFKVLADCLVGTIAKNQNLNLKERIVMTIQLKKLQHKLQHLLDTVF